MHESGPVDPKAAARAHAEAVVANNIGAVVLSMTADAFAKAMDIGNTTWGYLGYELEEAGQDDLDHLFDITYRTDQGPFTLRDRFRLVDGEWKVVDLEQIQ
jgi:hypothetical protein